VQEIRQLEPRDLLIIQPIKPNFFPHHYAHEREQLAQGAPSRRVAICSGYSAIDLKRVWQASSI
jgi:hypothetical protein